METQSRRQRLKNFKLNRQVAALLCANRGVSWAFLLLHLKHSVAVDIISSGLAVECQMST